MFQNTLQILSFFLLFLASIVCACRSYSNFSCVDRTEPHCGRTSWPRRPSCTHVSGECGILYRTATEETVSVYQDYLVSGEKRCEPRRTCKLWLNLCEVNHELSDYYVDCRRRQDRARLGSGWTRAAHCRHVATEANTTGMRNLALVPEVPRAEALAQLGLRRKATGYLYLWYSLARRHCPRLDLPQHGVGSHGRCSRHLL